MNGNPFYVDPGQGIGQQLAGLGQVIGQTVEKRQAKNLADEAQSAATAAYRSGDPNQMMEAAIKFPQIGQQMSAALGFQDKQKQDLYRNVYRQVLANPENAPEILTQGINEAATTGVDYMALTDSLGEYLTNPESARLQTEMIFAASAPNEWQVFQQSRQPKIDKEFAKEERKIALDSVKQAKKQASEINQAYGKIESLAGKVDPETGMLTRSAGAAALMSFARLISPGVVTDKDLAAVSGQSNPISWAISTISGRNPELAEEMQRYVDPLGNVDPNEILPVAKSIAGSSAPDILKQFEEARSRAKPTLSKKAFEANFGEGQVGSIMALSRFVDAEPAAVADSPETPAKSMNDQALDWARANPNDPRAARILQKLGVE